MPGPALRTAAELHGGRLAARDGVDVVTDFGDPAGEHAALRAAVGLAPRGRAFVRVHGKDAVRFLQGLLSNDVEGLEVGSARYALLLTPKARVIADPRVLRLADDDFVLDVEPAAGALLRATLTRYRLAAKALIEPLDGTWSALALGGPGAGLALLDALGVLPRVDAPEGEGFEVAVPGGVLHGVTSAFCGEKGFELVGPDALVAEAFAALLPAVRARGGGPVGADALEVARIEAGLPRFGAEIDEQVMPAEAGLVDRAVSFTKGCYVGQEPVARLHYRGHANRGLRALVLDGAVPPPGAAVVLDGRDVGRVTSAADSPSLGRALALAIVRREVDEGARVSVSWDGTDVEAEVAPLPPWSWRLRD